MEQRAIYRRLAALHREMAGLFESLARMAETADRPEGVTDVPAPAVPPRPDGTDAIEDGAAEADVEGRAIACLESLGIAVVGEPQRSAAEEGLERLARLIANKYENVGELLRAIRRAQTTGGLVRLDLHDGPQARIADVTLVCDLARKAGLLTHYDYRRAPLCRLACLPSRSPLAIRFFGGGWLELHVRRTLLDVLGTRAEPGDWGAVFGARVRLPDGDEFELDAFAVVGDRRIWIEAKSGQDFAPDRYDRIRRRLCRPSDHALLVWADYRSGDSIAAVRGLLAGMELCGLADLEGRLRAILAPAEDGETGGPTRVTSG